MDWKVTKLNDLKLLMRIRNIRAYEIAKIIGIKPSTLSMWMQKNDPKHFEIILRAILQYEENKAEELNLSFVPTEVLQVELERRLSDGSGKEL